MARERPDNVYRHLLTFVGSQASRGRTDGQLLQEFTAHQDEEAFATLLRRHAGLVWGVCRRILSCEADVEDAFQATFLVLARRAGSIRAGESVSSWLYGTAYRVALRAKKNRTRRQACERQAATRPCCSDTVEVARQELQALLEDELARLPAKYRCPFVLCCLEGKSRKEAAEELGWKEGTVSGRIAVARKRLQRQLASRGVQLSAALCTTALSPQVSLGGVPPALARATVEAALQAAASKGVLATGVSASAFTLAEGVLKSMLPGKLKAASSAILLVAALGTGLVSACYGILSAAPRQPAPTSTSGTPATQIDRLIAQLGSDQFAEREAAARELARLGPPVLEALRKASANPDLEIRRRAARLIPEIERRAEIDSLLTPTRIHLAYGGTVLPEAVADFSRRSGLPIELMDSERRLAGRKLTLDTGNTAWWRAFDALCHAGRLVPVKDMLEALPDSLPCSPHCYNVGMRLTSGTSEALATDYVGAFHVEARPAWVLSDGQPTPEDVHALALRVWPEPKVHWQSVQGLRIDKAVDDAGQVLRLKGDIKPSALEGVGEYVIVRLGKGGRPAKALKELAGHVTLRASTGPRALLSVDNLLKVTGPTEREAHGVYLKILDVKQGGGELTLRLQLKVAADVIPARSPKRVNVAADVIPARSPIRANKEDLVVGFTNSPRSGIVVLDAKGNRLPLPETTTMRYQASAKGMAPVVSEYELTYQLPPGSAADKLVYYGMRTVAIDLPIRLRDITLR